MNKRFLSNIPLFPKGVDLFTQMRMALSKLTVENTPGDLAASCTAPVIDGIDGVTADLSTIVDGDDEAVLTLTLNGLVVELDCDFGSVSDIEAVTVDEAVAAIDAAVIAAGYTASNLIDASKATAALRVTAADGVLGTSASMQFTGALAEALSLDNSGAAKAGTGAPSDFQLLVTSYDGDPAANVNVSVKIYDAASAGSLLADTQAQLASKGDFVSGECSNDAVVSSGPTGEIDFEVVSDISGGDELYIELALPAGYVLSSSPSSRTNITKTA